MTTTQIEEKIKIKKEKKKEAVEPLNDDNVCFFFF